MSVLSNLDMQYSPKQSNTVWSVTATSFRLTDRAGCPLYQVKENSEEAFPKCMPSSIILISKH